MKNRGEIVLQYVGDSKGLRNRVRQHCIGNVESSALRKTIATEMGFEIISVKRPSGSRKLTVSPPSAEQTISAYIQSGVWRVIVCGTAEEARDFQWYAIDKKRPLLNKNMKFWNKNNEDRYKILLENLLVSEHVEFDITLKIPTDSGVYSLWHDISPADFLTNAHNNENTSETIE